MPRDFFHGRHAGLLVPLFSLPSRESWGIGEIGDLPRLGAWMARAGFSFLQLLPINEMADGQNSPYSAMSAMAIDPIFISPAGVSDVCALGGEDLLPGAERALLKKARASKSIDYSAVRSVKLKSSLGTTVNELPPACTRANAQMCAACAPATGSAT